MAYYACLVQSANVPLCKLKVEKRGLCVRQVIEGLHRSFAQEKYKIVKSKTPLYWKHGVKSVSHHTPKFISTKASIKGLKFPKF